MHPLVKLAFYDELTKISAAEQKKAKATAALDRFKKWAVKEVLPYSAGTAAATGAWMLLEKAAPKFFGSAWRALPRQTQIRVLIPVAAVSGIAAHAAFRAMNQERIKVRES